MNRFEKSKLLFLDEGPLKKWLQLDTYDYPVIARVLDLVYEKHLQVIVSPVTLYEISKIAFEKRNSLLVRQYKEFFTHSTGFILRDIDAEIAIESAKFQNKYSISFEESLQLATAFTTGADTVFTLHDSWNAFLDAEVITLDSLKKSH